MVAFAASAAKHATSSEFSSSTALFCGSLVAFSPVASLIWCHNRCPHTNTLINLVAALFGFVLSGMGASDRGLGISEPLAWVSPLNLAMCLAWLALALVLSWIEHPPPAQAFHPRGQQSGSAAELPYEAEPDLEAHGVHSGVHPGEHPGPSRTQPLTAAQAHSSDGLDVRTSRCFASCIRSPTVGTPFLLWEHGVAHSFTVETDDDP